MSKYDLHTEKVPLPSRGLPYKKELGVPKEIPIRPFLTEDQKGLHSVGGTYGVDMLINNCINEPERRYKAKDLLSADKAALLLRLRAITLGSNFPVDYTCPHCNSVTNYNWDLNNIDINFLEAEEYPIILQLPRTQDTVAWRFLTDQDLDEVEEELNRRANRFESFNKDDERALFRRAQSIVSINDEIEDLISKWEYYCQLPAEDSAYIDFIEKELAIGPQIFRRIICKSPSCGREFTVILRTGMEFFRPKFKLPKGIGVKKQSLEEYFDSAVPASLPGEHTSIRQQQDVPLREEAILRSVDRDKEERE